MSSVTKRFLAATVVALSVGALALFGWSVLGAGEREDFPVLWEAPDFALVDQTGDTLRSGELDGTAWVAHFFFTNCAGICPLTTARMRGLRDSLAVDGLLGEQVRLVSISVDPARDTPPVLREYAALFGGSPPSEWAFLTGSSPEAIQRLLQEGFKVTATPPVPPADTAANYQVNHSPRLELVDPEGRVRATYDATEPDAIRRLLADLRALVP